MRIERKKVKLVETNAGLNFVVGLEQTNSIKPINTNVKIIDVEDEFVEPEIIPQKKVSYSYGHANILVLGLISIATIIIALFFIFK